MKTELALEIVQFFGEVEQHFQELSLREDNNNGDVCDSLYWSCSEKAIRLREGFIDAFDWPPFMPLKLYPPFEPERSVE